jgi:predicted flap endonuclease-1-like 5' DNA nuclease
MWIWALASGLAAAVVAQGALPGAMVFVLAVILFWLLLRPPQAAAPAPVAERGGPPRPSAAMARAALGGADGPDDLLRIKGLGPKLATALQEAGIRSYAQIAAWTPDEAAAMDEKFGARGRVLRDGWVAQARALALGGPGPSGDASGER